MDQEGAWIIGSGPVADVLRVTKLRRCSGTLRRVGVLR